MSSFEQPKLIKTSPDLMQLIERIEKLEEVIGALGQSTAVLTQHVIEVKSVIAGLKININDFKGFLEQLGTAVQDIVDEVQPKGYPVREGVVPKEQPAYTSPCTPNPPPKTVKSEQKYESPGKRTEITQNNISDLKDGAKKVCITGKIIMKEPSVRTQTGKFMSKAVIQDSTGSIRLILWEDQIEKVKEGDIVTIENGYVSSYKGAPITLQVGQYGSLKVEQL
jgi:replication factor A1